MVLRFGVAGLGRAAFATVPAILRHADCQVVAAADTRVDVLTAFCSTYSARPYDTVEELCADSDVDAVYIATPTHLHTEHVLAAARWEKNIIAEKPLAISLDDARRMIEAVDAAGVVMIVGQSQSYEPPIRAIRDLVRSGHLGALRMINGWYYNDWLYRPRLPAELDTAQGGGVVFRQGAHHFDISRFIGGGLVRSVRATTGVWDPARPTEGSYVAFLDFENGAVANLVYSGYDHFHTTELTGQTEGGTRVDPTQLAHAASRRAIADAAGRGGDAALKANAGFAQAPPRTSEPPAYPSYFGLLLVSCDRGDIRQSPEGLVVYGDRERWTVPLRPRVAGRDVMIAELYDAVTTGRPPLHTARWARATLEVSLAVLESARTRSDVPLVYQVPTPD
ncbi:MAG: Gfo/Idh/MocA family oxidoreductase [Chloroflexota bacterium]